MFKKLITSLAASLLFASVSFAAAEKSFSPEDRQKMAQMHSQMAACLQSTRPMSECHQEMMKSCQGMMNKEGCPMMGSMGGEMMGKAGGMMKGHSSSQSPAEKR